MLTNSDEIPLVTQTHLNHAERAFARGMAAGARAARDFSGPAYNVERTDAQAPGARARCAREPAPSVKVLADRLGRDYKRVHEDVETLTASGLLQRKEGRVSAPYDAITAEMRL